MTAVRDFVVVDRGERDLEEVADPRLVVALCPACGARVRLVERALVKNFRVLGVALLATEPAQRVYQCPRCEGLCAREGEDLAPTGTAAIDDEAQLEALTERILAAEDERALWSQRARIAAQKGDAALAREMAEQAERASRAAVRLRRELGVRPDRSRAEETAPGRPVETASEAAPGPAPGSAEVVAPQGDPLEDELAALRARMAEKKPPKAPAPAAAPEVVDDEMAALKAKLGRPTTAAAAETESANEAPPGDVPKPGEPGDDDELAALKRKLRS